MIARDHACTFRYRVIELIGLSEYEWKDGTTSTSGFTGAGATREFKTLAGAKHYQEELHLRTRHPVLLQIGCLQWLNEDEATEWARQHQGDPWE